MTETPITILNVDDNTASLYAKSRTLRHAGYRVLEAMTGTEALRLIAEERPQLVLLDVRLPDLSGLEVCRRIKADPNLAATMVLQNSASFTEEQDRVRALDGGADAYLTEPVTPRELLANIRALIRLHRAEAERARLLAQEQAARRTAENALRAKDEFFALLSHELRTPINAVLGWTQVLRRQKTDEKTLQHALEVIERNALAQNRLVDDLLDVSSLITGKLRLEIRPLDLSLLVASTVETVQPAAHAKGIRLQVKKAEEPPLPGQPAAGSPFVVTGDANRLQQVLWNLLSNAIKFTAPGGQVEVRLARHKPLVRLVVSDTGEGINPEFLPYVFDRFSQADTSHARRQGGLGLGLALVRHLVELHGGQVSVESPGVGKGATFIVDLPLQAAHPESLLEEMGYIWLESGWPSATTLAGLWVLLVDDDREALALLSAALESYGARTTAVTSAPEALRFFTKEHAAVYPDVLVSDIAMPGQDGYFLITQLRQMEHGREVPAIALTAFSNTEDRLRTLSSGFQMHVPKPVEPAELAAVVASVTGRFEHKVA